MEANPPNRRNGRVVAIGLILLCLAAFAATVWNYTRTHPFANEATLISATQVEAIFSENPKLQNGQRAVVSISEAETKGGTVIEISETGRAVIQLDSEVSAPAGSRVHVNIDGTLAPQRSK